MKFQIHPLFLVVFVVSFVAGVWKYLVVYSIVLLLHELAHFFVAKKLGYVCEKIKLMPYGAVLYAEDDAFGTVDEFVISLAGPLFNLLMCVLCVCVWWVAPTMYESTQYFMLANLGVGLINLLPVFPLDGGRVVLAVLSKDLSRGKAVSIVKVITVIFSLMLFVLFVFLVGKSFNFSIAVFAFMLLLSVFDEDKKTVYHRCLAGAGKLKKASHGLVVKAFMISCAQSVAKMMRLVCSNYYAIFLVCDDEFNVLGQISEKQLLDYVEAVGVVDGVKEVLGYINNIYKSP
ncbi:MAG: site-2 protease family protein [Clostridia bacterium]|nr:site-2 protease family protein [Clostridia bacterium]